ncbi:MAG TPA: hypothetical protein VK537_08745 [Galbitalea sp.]|nr:hypothetical protein [Galbitalea sp.]
MTERSLVTALSHAFVAFTIEADNEFESRMPHRTAADRGDPSKTGPWLTSLTFWANYLRRIPENGCTVAELARGAGDDKAAIKSRLGELQRWRYVRFLPGAGDPRDRVVVPTEWGVLARETWGPIEELVEARWRERFGDGVIDGLRQELTRLQVGSQLPVGFPILAWGHATRIRPVAPSTAPTGLSTLLARTILAMAQEFDLDSPLSLSMTQNLMRVLSVDRPSAIRDLPLRAGVSKEAIAIAAGHLVRGELAAQSGTPKSLELTARGYTAAKRALARRDELDDRWGASTSLVPLLAPISGRALAAGLEPRPDGWRARSPYLAQTRAVLADPDSSLPAFPMVSHRGGYPDGS